MKTVFPFFALLLLLLLAGTGCRSTAPGHMRTEGDTTQTAVISEQKEDADLPGIGETPPAAPSTQSIEVSDPIEPINRAFFTFNDKLYFWMLKPLSQGYSAILPMSARRCVKNFFSNIATPVRLVNCTLQAEFDGAWIEIERFAINTTVGVAGFGDPARNRWQMEKRNEDLGQTLGRYGLGTSIYLNWPILGPSNVRDTAGYAGDLFLDPINYLIPDFWYNVGIRSYETVNGTSLRVGDYEDFKEAAIDPYVALRDAYYQYRKNQVNNNEGRRARPAGPTE